jgi:glutaminyl-tRNA synthetase
MTSPNVQNAAAPAAAETPSENAPNVIHEMIDEEIAEGRITPAEVHTRFPPEPNGYLHIGHAKSLYVNFGTAEKYGGLCNLRFDDTNPTKEEQEFVDSIQADIKWLGYDWGDRLFFASDYFEQLYQWAEQLILAGKAYVDESTAEELKAQRGDFHKRGQDSRFRNRPNEESLDLFRRMRAGEFPDGAMVLRAKIDMSSGNINLRDPAMYRILRAHHHRTGDTWCIYPMYDYAHGESDAIEGITHSLCTLEFEDHRPLYDWFCEAIGIGKPSVTKSGIKPRQTEFAKLNPTFTLLSKRNLRKLVEEGIVEGWDDPRMPTLAGLRRRGVTPESIKKLCERVGVSKRDSVIDITLFEHIQREDLNARCERRMAVLKPLRLVIENFPEGRVDQVEAQNHPERPDLGARKVAFSSVVYVERDDFREVPPKGWHRLAPGKEVRLRYACLVTCKEVIKDASGEVIELRCTYDEAASGGNPADGRKVRGTIHWVSADHAIDATVRLYDRLFAAEDPSDVPAGKTFMDHLNPASLELVQGAKLEASLASPKPGTSVQFERMGYFCADPLSTPAAGVWNRVVMLKDSWAKQEKRG